METQEAIVDNAIKETQESTGTISGKEFGNKVEEQVEQTTTALREEFGDAADEIVGDTTSTFNSWRASMSELIGDSDVGNTEEEGAAGYVVRSSKQMVLSKRGTDLHVDDRGYRKRVLGHETVHKEDQATSYTSQEVKYLDDNTGQIKTASVVGNLTERGAIRGSGQPDGDLVPEYVEHAKIGDEVAGIVGEGRLNQAMSSGDTASLQEEIIKTQHQKIMEHLQEGEGLSNEQN